VLAFLRGSGRNEDAARELAHEFFARLLERPSLDRLERGRSRFRSYLLGAVKHFLADAQARVAAKRRGGGQEHVPLRAASDTTAAVDPPDPKAASPETEFDRQWAVTLLDRALHDLATEHTTRAERRQFEVLKPWLTGDAAGLSQRDAARQLAMNEGAIKVAIHRLRRRFRAAVKARIRDTVSSAEEVPGELDYLIRILGS
jgi:DNA-directed RNA polymerase specialized sigma24 family protein